MLKIIGMSKEELIGLEPWRVNRPLSGEEIIYIAETVGTFWRYDYKAAKKGAVGLHAELKSGLHSDGFFNAKALLSYPNIRKIMASQLAFRYHNQFGIVNPDWVGGIPTGASELGKDMARIMKSRHLEMKKDRDGRIVVASAILPLETVLLAEDVCTKGTAIREAVRAVKSKQPRAKIPACVTLINRGGLTGIEFKGEDVDSNAFGGDKLINIIAIANHPIRDWHPRECYLCILGSYPIKPKATEENWRLLTTSQRM